MKTQKLTFHCDPSHGWLEVYRKDIEALGLAEKISPYSYERSGFVFLEEDRDADLYLNAVKAAGYTINITERYTDSDSPIRNMRSFSNKVMA